MSSLRVLAFCILAVGALAGSARAQAPRTETVLPVNTDPTINGWLSAHAAAYSTTATHRDLLFVYLHGQGGTGTGAMELLKTAAEQGFHAVGLTYANDWSPFVLCPGGGSCPEDVRREIIEGVDYTSLINVTRPNSVENRIIKLVAFLHAAHPTEGWNQFVVNNVIQWDKIVVWGHSQGGGNAGVIARLHAVARCCTSAPAADGGPGNPAAWWATHATPTANYFGFCHTQDQLTTKVAFWNAIGMGTLGAVTDIATATPPYGNTHELSTSVAPAISGQFHNSVVADAVTPRDANNIPIYKPAWTYMMTAGLNTPGNGAVWDDVVFATVPGFAGPVQVKMDIYAATSGTGPRPLLVWIHGGGWVTGSHDQVPSFALALRARGITVASIGYRLSGEAVFPAHIHDCKGAIRFLRANAATYNIDPNRVGVWGSSAGGHLASLVATSSGVAELEGDTGGNLGQSSAVMVGASFYGPTDIMVMAADCDGQLVGCGGNHDDPASAESGLIGVNAPGQGLAWLRANLNNPAAPFPEKAHLAAIVNPIAHVDRTDPPMYIAHGDQDTTVPIGQSLRLRDALLASGVPVIYLTVPGFGHGSLGGTASDAAAQWVGDALLGTTVCAKVTSQPQAAAACDGQSASFSVIAVGTGTLTYQWQIQTAPGIWATLGNDPMPMPCGGFAFATPINAPSVSIGASGCAGPFTIRCIVSNSCGQAASESTTLTIRGQRCQAADIAWDSGEPLPPLGVCDASHTNSGVNEGDYNAFFAGFFDALPQCDIANDDGTPCSPFGISTINNGVNEGDYNGFFLSFFDGCP